MTQPEQVSRTENVLKLREMIKDIQFAMLTTQEADGSLRSRPMGTQQAEFDGDLWFFTGDDSPKADEIRHERQVNVSYAAPDKQRYVSITGMATIVKDKAKMAELWQEPLKLWFPQGLDDPNLALIKVTVQQAEYWDSSSTAVGRAIDFVKALVKGDDKELGENRKLDLA